MATISLYRMRHDQPVHEPLKLPENLSELIRLFIIED